MVFFSAMPGFFLILAVFLQSGYGLSPLHSGLATVPFPVGVLIASIVSGRLGIRFQRQRILAGAFILIAVMVILRHVVSGVGDTIVSNDFILPLFFGGFGTGLAISPLFQVVLAVVPGKDAGAGSGALQAVQQMGGAFGVAIISEIYFSTIASQMQAGISLHEAFKTAFMNAVWYNIACYFVVAMTVSLLKATVPTGGSSHAGAPPPME
jgi:predicted MFS family arabinose efflux permease